MSEWIRGQWWSAGEATPISPEEMWRRGWRWLKRAKPPKIPIDLWLSIHHPTGAAIYSSGVVCFAFRSGKTLKETQAILDEAIRITQ